MHFFDDLIYRSTAFTLSALKEVNSKTIEKLQTGASTLDIKNFQMVQLQKAIIAIGMFSLFDSILQQGLSCQNGFEEAKKTLIQTKNIQLHNRFEDFICAINVLKHGKGRSYNALLAKSGSLPFRLKLLEDNFFDEGDISVIYTLVDVDDEFVLNCAELIRQVSNEVRKIHSSYYL